MKTFEALALDLAKHEYARASKATKRWHMKACDEFGDAWIISHEHNVLCARFVRWDQYLMRADMTPTERYESATVLKQAHADILKSAWQYLNTLSFERRSCQKFCIAVALRANIATPMELGSY